MLNKTIKLFSIFTTILILVTNLSIEPASAMGEKTFKTQHKKKEVPDEFSKFKIPEINSSTAYKLWNGKKAVFVDALDEESYRAQHIPGAINLPASDPETNWHEFLDIEKDDIIITYSSSKKCEDGKNLAKYLKHKGYTQVYYYKPGLKGWTYNLLPIESENDY